MGAEGGLALTCDTQFRSPAIPVDVVDTVGAGDTFDAGFVYGYLQGWSLDKALKLGIICGSLSTRNRVGLKASLRLNRPRFISKNGALGIAVT